MTKPMRQSKFAVIAMVMQTAKDLLLPFVFVMLQGQRALGQQALWTGGFLVVALVFGVVRWFFFTYELTPHEITVHQGVFVKRRTHGFSHRSQPPAPAGLKQSIDPATLGRRLRQWLQF